MSERRGAWYLLTGVVVGIALGLVIAWGLAPVQYVDTTPATLRHDFKDEYRYMIAAAYSTTGNLGRARARLAVLGDSDPVQALGQQAQAMLANNTSKDTIRILADLSQALQADPGSATTTTGSAQPVSTALAIATLPADPDTATNAPPTDPPPATASASPQPSDTPGAPVETATRPATHTPTSTPGAPFTLANQATFCQADRPGLLQINLKDAAGLPAAGVELVITWLGGEEHFYTGLKPELGDGYADFVMSPDVEYALTLSNGATRVTGLKAAPCTATDGSSYLGGIHLDFQQPGG